MNVGGSVGGTQFDCFFIAIILAPSSTARAMAISPPIRAIIRVLDRFLYRGLYHCPCCVARRVDSRRVLGGCAQNAPSPRHSTRKENRSLPLHNCILRNVTACWGIIDSSRSRHPRRISESSIVTFQTKSALGFVRNEFWGASDQLES